MDRVTFLVEDHALPIGVFALMLPAGCLHDPPGLEGLAYLTGQLLLCGAGPMSQAEFADELDTIGSSLNAGTGRDALSLSGDALLRHVGDFQRLVASALVEPSLSASELARLKRRTLAELAQVRDNDSALGQRCFMEAAFSGHPYGRRLKGTEESIGRITRDDVVAFHDRHVRAPGLAVGSAGAIDVAGLEAFAAATVGRRPPGAPELPLVAPAPELSGYRVRLVDKPDRRQTQVLMGHSTLDANHEDYLALLVGQTIFGGTFTARLSRELRERRGWTYGAYSFLSADRRLGSFLIRFHPTAEHTAAALEVCDEMFRSLVGDGVTDEEVDFARRYLTQSHVFSIETPDGELHERLGAYLQGRPPDWLERFVERVDALEPDQINAALRRHLRPDDVTVAVVCAAEELRPELERWGRLASLEVVDYRKL